MKDGWNFVYSRTAYGDEEDDWKTKPSDVIIPLRARTEDEARTEGKEQWEKIKTDNKSGQSSRYHPEHDVIVSSPRIVNCISL